MTRSGSSHWEIGEGRSLDLTAPLIMGILNVTPDSFHDGGIHDEASSAIERAVQLVSEGADVIDVGGESTRPGADRIDASEQIRRTVGVIAGLRARSDVAISIDTTLASVAEAALEAGADIINDVSAGTDDPAMFDLAAAARCGLILMHRLKRPSEDTWSDQYHEEPDYGVSGVVDSVRAALSERVDAARSAGVSEAAIVVDPGLGFGKSVDQNLELLSGVPRLSADGRPVLVGASRKSFIGAVSGGEGPGDRLPGSLAAATIAVCGGASLIRTHDVLETARAVRLACLARGPAEGWMGTSGGC